MAPSKLAIVFRVHLASDMGHEHCSSIVCFALYTHHPVCPRQLAAASVAIQVVVAKHAVGRPQHCSSTTAPAMRRWSRTSRMAKASTMNAAGVRGNDRLQ